MTTTRVRIATTRKYITRRCRYIRRTNVTRRLDKKKKIKENGPKIQTIHIGFIYYVAQFKNGRKTEWKSRLFIDEIRIDFNILSVLYFFRKQSQIPENSLRHKSTRVATSGGKFCLVNTFLVFSL